MNVNEIQTMYKEAQFALENADAIGAHIFQLVKRAQEGDPAANNLINAAEQGAMVEDAAAQLPPPAEQGDGSQPGTIGPNGMMTCPNCGTQMTPTLDLLCPACGADVSQVIAQGMEGQPPAVGATGTPEEEVVNTAAEVKQSAMQNPEILAQLVNQYAYVLQQ